MSEGLIQTGPLLTLARERRFNRVILLETHENADRIDRTERVLRNEMTEAEVERWSVALDAGSDFARTLPVLRETFEQIARDGAGQPLTLSLASSEPHVQAACLFLKAAGVFEGTVIEAVPMPPHPGGHFRFAETSFGNGQVDLPQLGSLESMELNQPEEPLIEDILQDLGLIGEHPRFRRAVETAASLAPHELPLLILGETGTGKDRFARFIHRLSARRGKPFVMVNCASLPAHQAESLLFGHKEGAVSGAYRDAEGRCQLADGGTLYLNEIDELGMSAQAAILQLVEESTVEPLGGEADEVNIRVIASSSRDLLQQVSRGVFREDLYYRLRGGEIRLPSLRERSSDIPMLALEFLRKINADLRKPRQLSHEALRVIGRQEFPGNIRDLQMLVERAAVLAKEDLIQPRDLYLPETGAYTGPKEPEVPVLEEGFSMETYLSGARKRLFTQAMRQANGNQSLAARLLGVTPQAVHNFLRSQREAGGGKII
ncbi:MAG: sigma 54-interacting transcriptional regulator [Verrucomicrobiota bacterium]